MIVSRNRQITIEAVNQIARADSRLRLVLLPAGLGGLQGEC